MNPCPCGYLGDRRQACRCSFAASHAIASVILGPAARPHRHAHRDAAIDQRGALGGGGKRSARGPRGGRASLERCAPTGARGARLAPQSLGRLECAAQSWSSCSGAARLTSIDVAPAAAQLRAARAVSARGLQRLLAVSRTIADLAASETIEPAHLAEAVHASSLPGLIGPATPCSRRPDLIKVIGQIGATALGRHDAGLAVVTIEGVLIKRRLTLGDARSPGRPCRPPWVRRRGRCRDRSCRPPQTAPCRSSAPPAAPMRPAPAGALISIAELSWPATASWQKGGHARLHAGDILGSL